MSLNLFMYGTPPRERTPFYQTHVDRHLEGLDGFINFLQRSCAHRMCVSGISISTHAQYMCMYIYIERERDKCMYIYIHIYISIHTDCVFLYTVYIYQAIFRETPSPPNEPAFVQPAFRTRSGAREPSSRTPSAQPSGHQNWLGNHPIEKWANWRFPKS